MSVFRVIVIDDNKVELALHTQVIKNLNQVEVHAFDNAYDALNYCMLEKTRPIHLVLCDWSMPGMNGYAFLKAFRSFDKHTPFLMITSHTEKNFVIESKRAGATGYIAKPYSSRRLLAKLEKYQVLLDCNQVA